MPHPNLSSQPPSSLPYPPPSGNPALFAEIRLANNHKAMSSYAASLCAILALFLLLHHTRSLSLRYSLSSHTISAPFVYTSRLLRNILLRKAPLYFPSNGHALVVTAYIALNIVFCFANIQNNARFNLCANMASRTGWLATANFTLSIFLSLKNTPLKFLMSWTYERLNILHRLSGLVSFIFVIVHAIIYSVIFVNAGRAQILTSQNEIYGITAAAAMFLLVFAAIVIRPWWYELFYAVHILMWIVAIIMLSWHQPSLIKNILVVTGLCAGMWGLDKLFRFTRLLLNSLHNTATLEVLPHNATRVTIKKAPWGSYSSTHAYLWLPAIRPLEMHPFTLVSSPAGSADSTSTEETHEFVIAAYDGFTRSLHEYAKANPHATIRCAVEGPYGASPEPTLFDKLVIVGGGSGGSFTFGTAMRLLINRKAIRQMDFHWIIKDRHYFLWYSHLISILAAAGPMVSVTLHISRESGANPQLPTHHQHHHHRQQTPGSADDSDISSSPIPPATPALESEKLSFGVATSAIPSSSHSSPSFSDPEKVLAETTRRPSTCPSPNDCPSHAVCKLYNIHISRGRPDIEKIVIDAVNSMKSTGKVMVVGCGPVNVMNALRNGAARSIKPDGPTVELHTEAFDW